MQVRPASSAGHWRVSVQYRKGWEDFTTTDAMAVDDFRSDPDNGYNEGVAHLRGYRALKAEFRRLKERGVIAATNKNN